MVAPPPGATAAPGARATGRRLVARRGGLHRSGRRGRGGRRWLGRGLGGRLGGLSTRLAGGRRTARRRGAGRYRRGGRGPAGSRRGGRRRRRRLRGRRRVRPVAGRGTGVEDPVETTRPSEVPEVLLLETGWPITASATLMAPMATTKTPTTTAVRRAKGLRPPHRRGGPRDRAGCWGRCSGPWTTGRGVRPTPPSAGGARAAGCRRCAASGRRPPSPRWRRRNRRPRR